MPAGAGKLQAGMRVLATFFRQHREGRFLLTDRLLSMPIVSGPYVLSLWPE